MLKQLKNTGLLLLVLQCLPSGITKANTGNIDQLLNKIENIRQQHHIAAVGISLIKNNKSLWSGGLGNLDHNAQSPVSERTIFRVGSISKSFTSLAILKLQEAGKLNLNDPINKWLSKELYQNAWADSHPILIRHLLEHTAGFQDISKEEFDYNTPGNIPLIDNLAFFSNKHKTMWPPGLYSSYSNLGAAYAGHIIELASKQKYETYIRQKIFKPLDMKNSGFFLKPQQKKNFALGYNTDGISRIPYWNMVYRPFGGINSTTKDMSRFVHMLINKGQLSDNTIADKLSISTMETPAPDIATQPHITLGYGAGMDQWTYKGILFHGHTGDADGYLSRYGYTRSNNSGYFVVITAFNHNAINKIRRHIESFLVTSQPTLPKTAPYHLKKTELSQISGHYNKATSRFGKIKGKLIVIIKNGRIYNKINNRPERELIPVSPQLFRYKNEIQASITISKNKGGDIIFRGNEGNYIKSR